jgi:hypothetical protein
MTAVVQQGTIGRSIETVSLENELVRATVLVNKGADIYELRWKPADIDVLWKSPWGLLDPGYQLPSSTSGQSWLDAYEGGWQILFPSGAGPSEHMSAELPFHGEASLAAWTLESADVVDGAAEVQLSVRLRRSPFRLQRTMRLEADQSALVISELIRNEGGEPVEYMWGHHPAFGAPFLSGACVIDTGARALEADDSYASALSPLALSERMAWPMAGSVDLSIVPGQEQPRTMLGYLRDFESGWYAITNRELGFGVGLVWPAEILPYAWMWQEMHATSGFPWYRGCYVMAIEPNTSLPGQGLRAVMDKTGTHRTLAPGSTAELELRAVLYESTEGVHVIDPRGRVKLKAHRS